MKKLKKIFKILIITVLVIALLYAALPFIFMGSSGINYYKAMYNYYFLNDPPKPKITYGEFPFTLEYELNGERKIIEDTLICEYDGVDWTGDYKYFAYYTWNERFKSGNKRLVLAKIDKSHVIYYPFKNVASYFMGVSSGRKEIYIKYADIADLKKKSIERVDEKELYEKYNIRIISLEITLPINNFFE